METEDKKNKIEVLNVYLDKNYKFVFELMGLIAICFSIWAYINDSKESRESEEKNYQWQRKILTQDKLDNNYDKIAVINDSISKLNKLIKEDSTDSKLTKELNKQIIKKLNIYEGIARGVNIGIYDLNVVDITWGNSIRKFYKQSSDLISKRRMKNKNAWAQLDSLVKKIEPKHKESNEDDD